MSLREQTEARRRDLATRMKADMWRENPMLSERAVDILVDHGMFYVEHLLAEIEELRTDVETRTYTGQDLVEAVADWVENKSGTDAFEFIGRVLMHLEYGKAVKSP